MVVPLGTHLPSMDESDELERMALNATAGSALKAEEEPSSVQIAIWQRLLQYSYYDAADTIKRQRNDLARTRISDEHWNLVQLAKETKGYDREAYEHEVQLSGSIHPRSLTLGGRTPNLPVSTKDSTFIFKLEGPLDGPEKVQAAAGLPKPPEIIKGFGEEGEASFCRVDTATKRAIKK